MPKHLLATSAEGLPSLSNLHADNLAFQPMTPALRRRIEATIDSLLALLDAVDGDPDLEDDNLDEPALGAPENHPASKELLGDRLRFPRSGILHRDETGTQRWWADGAPLDDENELETDEDEADAVSCWHDDPW